MPPSADRGQVCQASSVSAHTHRNIHGSLYSHGSIVHQLNASIANAIPQVNCAIHFPSLVHPLDPSDLGANTNHASVFPAGPSLLSYSGLNLHLLLKPIPKNVKPVYILGVFKELGCDMNVASSISGPRHLMSTHKCYVNKTKSRRLSPQKNDKRAARNMYCT